MSSSNSPVHEFANVRDHAQVDRSATVSGNAKVRDHARVYGNSFVLDSAQVRDRARVFGSAEVGGHAQVSGDARVSGCAHVFGDAQVSGDAILDGCAAVDGTAKIDGSPEWPVLYGDALYSWTLFREADGGWILRYGCERLPLDEWADPAVRAMLCEQHDETARPYLDFVVKIALAVRDAASRA